ncbi:hypothetical protein HDU80_003168 [Chytriomyces hyalinus]|nr:hypothetical protein HDU80_003168 [Chytriomyces hyalinus]
MTSANGGGHAIWDLADESPFSKAPGLLLAGLMIPATQAIDISKNDQLVAVSYTNGSTYIWNMNQDQIGGELFIINKSQTTPQIIEETEKKLSNSSVLLHPDHSSSKPGQNKRISALCFNLSSSSYPFIALAYRDRVVFVDSRTKRYVHSQVGKIAEMRFRFHKLQHLPSLPCTGAKWMAAWLQPGMQLEK